MSIPVKRVKRKQILSDPASPELYYLVLEPGKSDVVTEDDLADDAEMIGGMSREDAIHILGILIRRMRFYLTKGNKVKIGGLGTFHLTFHNKGTEEEKDCTVRNINKVNIRFKVDKNLRMVNESTVATRSDNSVKFYIKGETTTGSSGGGNDDGGDDDSGGGWIDPTA
ncbi:DNA-binding protein [Bacteroides sp. 519]|uniref:HU family DNA-binding protein n=1 Tax=Bacteroides sp. 519 TaxID=2302937 RepID=UPI0013D3F445|nr:DNA-binding protein [Bacteroides sp. 519]NDV59041.1 DNA-binding protein [Bacteroides sp. 519]